jgi:hypothetical protein
MDTLSRADISDSYIRRTQNYEMSTYQYIPAYTFRKFCAGNRAFKNEYPREIRNMWMEKRKYDSILD